MATPFTRGILTGEVTTFQQFAKLCMRATGAAMHMFNESLSEPFKPDEVSGHHAERILEIQSEIDKEISDEALLSEAMLSIDSDIDRVNNRIEEEKINKSRLLKLITETELWVPPTEGHDAIKIFMLEQLKSTLKWESNGDYLEESLANLIKSKNELSADVLRKQRIGGLTRSLERAREDQKIESDSIEKSNKWIQEFYASLETPE